ncbi:MAG: HAMP domain-containing sensor histidine kinase [Pseudomonadota bacterium]
MFRRYLYMQICMVVVAGLLVFAVAGSLLWSMVGHEEYNGAVFDKSSDLATLLLPPPDSTRDEQAKAIQEIARILELDITLWSEDRQLIAASGPVNEPAVDQLSKREWIATEGETYWTTVLSDGRWVVVDLDRIAVPSDRTSVAIILVVLAVLIAVIMLPFARRLTRRLESLQQQVVRIGQGDLKARVDVRGTDEIALLAHSFNESADRIEELVNAQRMLLANTSHELRTPLARIRLGIEMIQKVDDPYRRLALQDDIKELDKLIDELILMTRLDSGFAHGDFEPVDLVALVAEECARYPDCAFVGKVSEISGDFRMLQHLVRNLVDNAQVHGASPVRVVLEQHGERVDLIVSDGGPGIPASEQSKVFEPFYRAADKQNVPGYGLGLPMVSRIAEIHQATISVRNRPRSEVRVSFPASTTAAYSTHDHTAPVPRPIEVPSPS